MADPSDPAPIPDAAAGVRMVLDAWGQMLAPVADAWGVAPDPKDKRFAAPEWQHPVFDLMRQGYAVMSDAMLQAVDAVPGLDPAQRDRTRFAMKGLIDAMSPSNGLFTNPVALNRALDTGGASVAEGAAKLLTDLKRGQLTQTAPGAFEVGRNLATTPGQVVKRTHLYELIQYTPTTDRVLATPLVIFPPWINRFYILDLTPEKSFIRWAVEQGITVFMVSWKSADAALAETIWDDYIAAQLDAIDTIRDLLEVPAVHAIGYCVAGTTLAATLAVLTARQEAAKVASATFFTAQVDFAAAGELNLLVDNNVLETIRGLSPDGYLDGRYMAATFNLLRGRDLIWNYVTNNYLMGNDYTAFDLLHWNGDVTNLPTKWHLAYLADLYRDNRLVSGELSALGEKLDLKRVATPTYVQAGKEDHIAPAASVWEITRYFTGPLKFVLAGSGHIAGVVNPPAAGKYQYWTNDAATASLDEFVAGATEHKGSWWPDWRDWLGERDPAEVPAAGARVPGAGKLPALEAAPGRYVITR